MRFIDKKVAEQINKDIDDCIYNLDTCQNGNELLDVLNSFCEECGCMDFKESEHFSKRVYNFPYKIVYQKHIVCENCNVVQDTSETISEKEYLKLTCRI